MPDKPLTYQLVDAVRVCLTRIRKANGFHTDAGLVATTEPEQRQDTSDDDRPDFTLDVLLDKMQAPTDAALRGRGRLCVVAIVVKVPVGLADGEVRLHEVLEDIELALQDQRSRFPAGTDFPRFLSADSITPAKGVSWTGSVVRYTSHVRR